ncbi:MAG: precorrin-3B synthase [Ancalomicrobiaceae bacterium]|nr:precorrin-3B synthase [Ancalomicrobiaceae bacterium]
MSEPMPSVKGWCPGALRPMRSGDGLVVRLRLGAGVLTARKARIIADLGRRYGNGQIDLTQRANLQLRGVSDQAWPVLIGELSSHGLVDADAEVEAVNNIVVGPLAGLDPRAQVDGRAVAVILADRIAVDPLFRALPGKFGFAVDDGGALSLDDVGADVWLVGCDGGLDVEVRHGDGFARLARVRPEAAGDAAARIAAAFLDRRGADAEQAGRMRQLVARIGAAAVARQAGFDPNAVVTRPSRPVANVIGRLDLGGSAAVGLGIPFGRLTAATLGALADAAERAGTSELRLTPWRAVVIPGVATDRAEALLADLARAGCIVSPDDPRLAVVACPGAPDCDSAAGAVREDALALAEVAARMAGEGVRLHVSGCAKGCARPGATAATLVRRFSGYDLVVNGRAEDDPVSTGLSADDIEGALRRHGLIEGH